MGAGVAAVPSSFLFDFSPAVDVGHACPQLSTCGGVKFDVLLPEAQPLTCCFVRFAAVLLRSVDFAMVWRALPECARSRARTCARAGGFASIFARPAAVDFVSAVGRAGTARLISFARVFLCDGERDVRLTQRDRYSTPSLSSTGQAS